MLSIIKLVPKTIRQRLIHITSFGNNKLDFIFFPHFSEIFEKNVIYFLLRIPFKEETIDL